RLMWTVCGPTLGVVPRTVSTPIIDDPKTVRVPTRGWLALAGYWDLRSPGAAVRKISWIGIPFPSVARTCSWHWNNRRTSRRWYDDDKDRVISADRRNF